MTTPQPRDLTIKSTAVYRVSPTENNAIAVEPTEDNEEFNRFIWSIAHSISTQVGGRKFMLNSDETEVISIATKIVKEEDDMITSQAIANRLLREEKTVQQQMSRMGIDLHAGLLILAHIEDKGVEKFIICKAETLSFIEELTFRERNGYPTKKKIFKSAQIVFDDNKMVTEVIANDINNVIAKYWWEGFLEVAQKWTDDYNTGKAFEVLDSKIFAQIKKKSSTDYYNLRNTSIRYFRSELEFEVDDFIQKCFQGYQPEEDGLVMDDYIEKIKAFPEKHGFDSKFTLNRTVIKAKIKSTVHLSENIDLLLKGEVDIGTTIKGMLDAENRKGVFIRSDIGYDAFKGG